MLKAKTRKSVSTINPGKAAALSDAAKEPTTRLNANIPKSLYRQLKIKAAGDDLTINDLVEQWVRDYVNE